MLAVSHLANTNSPVVLNALKNSALQDERPGIRAQAIESLAYWPINDVGETLISCLSDHKIYDGLIASDQEALDILSQAAPELAARMTPAKFSHERTNGTRAAIILQKLSGRISATLKLPTTKKQTLSKPGKTGGKNVMQGKAVLINISVLRSNKHNTRTSNCFIAKPQNGTVTLASN